MSRKIAPIQTNFSGGRISPKMFGRIDSPLYQAAVAELQNMRITKQGSIEREPGTFLHENGINENASGLSESIRLLPVFHDNDDWSLAISGAADPEEATGIKPVNCDENLGFIEDDISPVYMRQRALFETIGTNDGGWTMQQYLSHITSPTACQYINGLFFVLSNNGYISVSEDLGQTWNDARSGWCSHLGYINSRWVINSNGTIYTNTDKVPDLTGWSAGSSIGSGLGGFPPLAKGNNLIITLGGTSGYGPFYYSSDGISWTSGGSIDSGVTGPHLAFGNGVFVIAGYRSGTQDLLMYTSTDGTSWTLQNNIDGNCY